MDNLAVAPGMELKRLDDTLWEIPERGEMRVPARVFAYKEIEKVVDVVESAGLAGRVARLRPIGVIKG